MLGPLDEMLSGVSPANKHFNSISVSKFFKSNIDLSYPCKIILLT